MGASAETKHGRVSSQLIELLTRIFSCGNMTAKEFQQMGVTVDDLIGCPWFQQDIPTGALDMRERCLEQTRARIGSTDYEHVREYLLLAAQEYIASTPSAAASPPGRIPSGAGWLPEVPAAKQQAAGGTAITEWMAGFAEEGYGKGGRTGEGTARSAGRSGRDVGLAKGKGGVMSGGDGAGEGMGYIAAGMDGGGIGAADMGGADGE